MAFLRYDEKKELRAIRCHWIWQANVDVRFWLPDQIVKSCNRYHKGKWSRWKKGITGRSLKNSKRTQARGDDRKTHAEKEKQYRYGALWRQKIRKSTQVIIVIKICALIQRGGISI